MPQQAGDQQAARRLERLWSFDGPAQAFWPALLDAYCTLLGAASALLLVRAREDSAAWQAAEVWPDAAETRQRMAQVRTSLEALADRCLGHDGGGIEGVTDPPGAHLFALRLELGGQHRDCVALFLSYAGALRAPSAETLRLMADTPLIRGAAAPMEESTAVVAGNFEPLPTALGLALGVNEQTRFLRAAMHLCNEVASGLEATRVSLGWLRGRDLRLRATSHVSRLDRKQRAVRLLEAAMEEALDQDDEVVWPPPSGQHAIDHDHATYARHAAVAYLASVPLRIDGDSVAVLTAERHDRAFDTRDVECLRLVCDLGARRLDDLRRADRWVGARVATAIGQSLQRVLGVEHTWVRLGVIAAAALVAFMVFYPWPYRVEAPFTVYPARLVHLPAPFDSFIREVAVEVGDHVNANQVLVELDRRELELRGAELRAAFERHRSEARLARSRNKTAEVHIATARADEARAQLEKVRFNLGLAAVRAPYDAIVVEGDLRERIGAPVKRGDPLLQLTTLGDLRADLRIAERDIQDVPAGARGEMAFASRPDTTYRFEVTLIEPLARADDQGNHFTARARFSGEAQPWWRPGMTGVAKVEVGERSLLWVVTHRLVDFVRLKLWL